MKKHTWRLSRGKLPVQLLFLAGFFLGTVIPNVFWRLEWKQMTMQSLYLLETFGKRTQGNGEYFLFVLRMRGSLYLLAALCGATVFGVPAAVLGMMGCGFVPGMILTMSVLQFGVSGGAAGLGLLFPQYLLYLPAGCLLLSAVYEESLEIWRGRGMLPRGMYRYGVRLLLFFMIYLAGILLEVYCNPWITGLLFEKLHLF